MEKKKEKADLEQRVELLEKVVKALCKWKQDSIHEWWVSSWNWDWKVHWLINDFEDAMENIDYDYKD